MDVGGPVLVAPGRRQQLPDRSVGGDRVIGRNDGPEVEVSLVVCGEQGPSVALLLCAWLLDVVESVGVGLPNIDHGARHGLSVFVSDAAVYNAGLAGAFGRDVVSEFAM